MLCINTAHEDETLWWNEKYVHARAFLWNLDSSMDDWAATAIWRCTASQTYQQWIILIRRHQSRTRWDQTKSLSAHYLSPHASEIAWVCKVRRHSLSYSSSNQQRSVLLFKHTNPSDLFLILLPTNISLPHEAIRVNTDIALHSYVVCCDSKTTLLSTPLSLIIIWPTVSLYLLMEYPQTGLV
jgi:hypothetical protein